MMSEGMKSIRLLVFCGLILGIMVLAASSVVADSTTFTVPNATWDWFWGLDPGKYPHRIVLEAGDRISWNWTSTAPLDFKLLDPNEAEMISQPTSIGTSGAFDVIISGTYSWNYTNKDRDLNVTVHFTYNKVTPTPPPSDEKSDRWFDVTFNLLTTVLVVALIVVLSYIFIFYILKERKSPK